MKLEYSQEFADKYGYAKAKLANGSEVKYTNHTTDESEAKNLPETKWKDKVIVFQGTNKDILSTDLTNMRNHKNFHDYNANPQITSMINQMSLDLMGMKPELNNGKNNAMIIGSIMGIRDMALKDGKKPSMDLKKPLK